MFLNRAKKDEDLFQVLKIIVLVCGWVIQIDSNQKCLGGVDWAVSRVSKRGRWSDFKAYKCVIVANWKCSLQEKLINPISMHSCTLAVPLLLLFQVYGESMKHMSIRALTSTNYLNLLLLGLETILPLDLSSLDNVMLKSPIISQSSWRESWTLCSKSRNCGRNDKTMGS